MIFPQEKQDVLEPAAIVGQTLNGGEYQVQRIIGQGGTVFLAMHTTLMIPMALRRMPADEPLAESVIAELDYILHDGDSINLTIPGKSVQEDLSPQKESATDRFAREALFLARSQHTSIPTLYDYFREDGYWYLVIDYISGYTLRTYLQQHTPLSVLEALNCALQICDALDYLHTQTPPIICRQLNTDTIMVTPEGILMLVNLTQHSQFHEPTTDKSTNEHTPHASETETATPHTDTPAERYTDALRLDITSDLYSLGIILHDMLYRHTLKQNSTEPADSEIPHNHTLTEEQEAQNTPYISTFLKSVLRLATRMETADRFQSAETFYLALERAYQIEEQRTFQQHLTHLNQQEEQTINEQVEEDLTTDAAQNPGSNENEQIAGEWEQGRQDTPPIILSHTLELEQRRLTRAALQRARWERLGQEQVEVQMTLVDKGLQQRSSMSHSQISLQAIVPPAPPAATIPIIQRFHRVIKVNFLLALVICVIMASLLIYIRIAQPIEDSIQALLQYSKLTQGHTQNTLTAQNIQSTKQNTGANPQNKDSTLADNYWQALPALPATEADNSMAYVELQGQAYIYMNGGYHNPSSAIYDHSLYRYNIKAASWETINNHFPGMVNNAATVDEQGHIFFTSGYSSDTYTMNSLLYIYDPGTTSLQKIISPAQTPLGFGGSMLADRQGHLYITQGFAHPGDPNAQAGTGWYRYDIATAQWNQLAALPVGLGYVFTASDNNGGILLLGGASDAGQHNATNKIYRYDIATDSWTQETNSLPQAISGASGCQAWPGQLAMIGGYDATHDTGNKNSWLIDLKTLKWRTLADLPIGGSVLGAAACDGKGHVFLERGTNTPRLPTSDYWELVVAPAIKIGS